MEYNSKLPVTEGRLLDFPNDAVACLQNLYREHGDIAALREGKQQIVFSFGPRWHQQILSDTETYHSRFFAIRGSKKSAHRRLTSGILSMNGHEHKTHRRLVMGPFQKKSLGNYHQPIVKLATDMLDRWQKMSPSSKEENELKKENNAIAGKITPETNHPTLQKHPVIDLNEEMTNFMLQETSAILFGVDIPKIALQLGKTIDRWVRMNHRVGMGVFVADEKVNADYELLLELAENVERDIRRLIKARRETGLTDRDVLSLFIKANEEGGPISDDQLVGHITVMFGAAHLTTAHTFAWTLFLLAQHPEIMRAVLQEIEQTFPTDYPSMAQIENMPIVDRVIKESMRILPASGYSQRVCMKPTTLGPFELNVGTPVIFSQFMTHRIPEIYPQPEKFDPDRWLNFSPSPYEYLPFGAGPRMCLGAPMSLVILKTVLPMILKRFRLQIVSNAEINGQIISTMLSPTSTIPAMLIPQDQDFQSAPVHGNIHTLVDLTENQESLRKAA